MFRAVAIALIMLAVTACTSHQMTRREQADLTRIVPPTGMP